MKKLFFLAALVPAVMLAQAPQVADTVTVKDTRTAVNTALTTLYNGVVKGGNATFTGPTTARTYTLPDANKTLMATDTAVTLAQLPASAKVRTCEIVFGDPGSSSSALADDNDSPGVCGNLTGATMTILEVKCLANSSTGSPSVLPIITGGAADSILTGAIACGNGVFGSAGTLNGTPTQVDGASIDANISTAGGTAKFIVLRIKRTL